MTALRCGQAVAEAGRSYECSTSFDVSTHRWFVLAAAAAVLGAAFLGAKSSIVARADWAALA
jgi:hypothetical protein